MLGFVPVAATSKTPYIPRSAWPGNPQMRRYLPGLDAVNVATAVFPFMTPSCGLGVSAPGKTGWGSAVAGGWFVKGMICRLLESGPVVVILLEVRLAQGLQEFIGSHAERRGGRCRAPGR